MQSSPSHSHLSPRKIILILHTSQHKISPRHQAPLHGCLRARLCWMGISPPRSFVGNRNTYVSEIHEKLPEIRRPQSMSMLYQISCLFEWDLVQTFQICGPHEIIHLAWWTWKGRNQFNCTCDRLEMDFGSYRSSWIDSSVSNFRFAEVQIRGGRIRRESWWQTLKLKGPTQVAILSGHQTANSDEWIFLLIHVILSSYIARKEFYHREVWGRNNSQFHCTGVGWKASARFRECCRRAQTEVLSKSRNKIHQTF